MSLNEAVPDCGVLVTRAASYVRPSDLRLTGHGPTSVGNARESSSSLQRISLVETVGNVTDVP